MMLRDVQVPSGREMHGQHGGGGGVGVEEEGRRFYALAVRT